MFERPGTNFLIDHSAERRDRIKKLSGFIESLAAEYHDQLGLPLDKDGRIDMDAYRSIYPGVDMDIARVRGRDAGKGTPEEVRNVRITTDGEWLEMLTMAILAKGLGSDFAVVRTSAHDDQISKADTAIIDVIDGSIVCLLDEVGDTSGRVDYQAKVAEVYDRNAKRGGVGLRYGVRLGKTDTKGSFVPDTLENIPLFYIALSKERIDRGVQEFNPSPTQQSDSEKKLFLYFIATLSLQIEAMEVYAKRLPPIFGERLGRLKKTLEAIKGSQPKTRAAGAA